MGSKKLNENYTEFASPGTPSWLSPIGTLGRFLARFFANKSRPTLARDTDDASVNTNLIPADAGDTILNPDPITSSPYVGLSRSNLILSPLEYKRKERYKEFEEMDEYPEISSAFDIYADECTQKGPRGEKWVITSNSEVIKQEVERLFKTVQLDLFLWDICRNATKYGDCFIESVFDLNNPKEGIQRIKILNPSFMLRSENEYGYLEGFLQEIPDKDNWESYGAQGSAMSKLKFIPLDREQIVHFRLHTSNPLYYPYGKSIAANARRVFKSLQMMEDAMLIYRLNRAPERRAFYINVGQLPPAKAYAALEDLKQSFKKQKFYDRSTNNVDGHYNPIAVDEDFWIPIRGANDGTKIEALQGAGNLGEIEDVRYFRDKLLAQLKIPKDFLVEKDKSPERKANLSQLDVKFARTIVRLQQCIQLGLQQLARLHLSIKGFPQTEIDNLCIELPDPSDLSLKRKLDVIEQTARAVKAMQGLGMFSKKYLYTEFFDFNEQDIEKIESELEKEVKLEAQGILPAIHPVGGGMEDPMMGGGDPDVPVDSEFAQSDESLNSRYSSGSDSRENNSPSTKENIHYLIKSSRLDEQTKKVLSRRLAKIRK